MWGDAVVGGVNVLRHQKCMAEVLEKKGSYRRWRARTCAPPWWRAACGAPCRRWTCARSAWYEPFCEWWCGCVGGEAESEAQQVSFSSYTSHSHVTSQLVSNSMPEGSGRLCSSSFAGPTGGHNCGKPNLYGQRTCTGTHFRSSNLKIESCN